MSVCPTEKVAAVEGALSGFAKNVLEHKVNTAYSASHRTGQKPEAQTTAEVMTKTTETLGGRTEV